MATKKEAELPDVITGYNMKLKKSDTLKDVKISKTTTGKYFAKGVGTDGTVVCTAMGEAKANGFIKAGMAKKDQSKVKW